MLIRDVLRGDAKVVGELNAAAWQHAYAGIVPERVLRERCEGEEDAERWWAILSSRVSRVAVEAGRLVGYASWVPIGDGAAELVGLYVHPDRWRSGIGRRLLGDALEGMQRARCSRLYVWVLERNERARRFYEAAGLTLRDERRGVPKVADPTVEEVRYERAIE